MAITDIFGPYAVQIGAAVIGGISQHGIGCNNELGGDSSSGEIYRRMQYLRSQQLAPTFTTRALNTALTACGVSGISLGTSSLILYSQKWLNGGSRATTGHHSHTMATGMLVPKTLSCDARGDAQLTYEGLLSSSDGTTCPITTSTSATLATLAVQDEVFTLGAVTIGGITMSGVKSVSIDFGIMLDSLGDNGGAYDKVVFIKSIEPSITIQCADAIAVGASGIAIGGAAATHANTSIALLKRVHGGSLLGSDDLELTACGMAIAENVFEASHSNYGGVAIKMECTYDGTNAPILIS